MRYFQERRISLQLATKINMFLENNADSAFVGEDEVEAIQIMPHSLRTDLREEAVANTVNKHHLMRYILLTRPSLFRRLASEGLREVRELPGSTIFSTGDIGYSIFFVMRGELEYKVGISTPVPAARKLSTRIELLRMRSFVLDS